MQTKPHILVVDDDARIRELLGAYLIQNTYYVTLAESAQHATQRMSQFQHDLMVLDVMMPNEDGVSFLRKLRASYHLNAKIPTILLTAQGQIDDRLKGLSAGADDYVSKPFEPQELLLRIQAVLRRSHAQASDIETVRLGPLSFVRKTRQLFQGDQRIFLTTAEESLLNIFSEHPNQVIERQALACFQGHETQERSIDVQINRLRRKIEQDPKRPRYLQTVRHKGYIFYPS